MEFIYTLARMSILPGDIASLPVDAIVNSAGSGLKGGGGCDGAIHWGAGPALARACAKMAPCPVGEVRITNGFRLPARLVIHTVAPRLNVKSGDWEMLLESCFRKSVEAADCFGARSVGIPAIGAGVRGIPPDAVARIAASACRTQLRACRFVRDLYFCVQTPETSLAFVRALEDVDPVVSTSAGYNNEIYLAEADYDFRFIYVAIVGMLQHEWAFLARLGKTLHVVFVKDSGSVFDSVKVGSLAEARRLVCERRFENWGPDSELSSFIPLPQWPPYKLN